MAKYALSVITGVIVTNAPVLAIRAGANRISVKRIKVAVTAPTAASIGAIRPATVGTPNVSALFQALQATSQASLTNIDTGWSAAPTLPGTPLYLERASIGGVAGNGDIWTFPDELFIEPGAALLLWNFGVGSTPAMQVTATIDE